MNGESFPGLPNADALVCHEGAGLVVRPPVHGDGAAVSWVLNDPELTFVPSTPSDLEAEAWVEDQVASWDLKQDDRSLLLMLEWQGGVVGLLSARFYLEYLAFDMSNALVPSMEWSSYRHSSAAGHKLVERAVPLVEPVLASHFALAQVVAIVDNHNEAGLAVVAGFAGPIEVGGGRFGFFRDPIP